MAGHAHALLARIVVEESHGPRAQLRVAPKLECHLLAAVARAHDQDLARGALEYRAAERAFDQAAP